MSKLERSVDHLHDTVLGMVCWNEKKAERNVRCEGKDKSPVTSMERVII